MSKFKVRIIVHLDRGDAAGNGTLSLSDPDTQNPPLPMLLPPAHANVHDNNHKIQVDCLEGCVLGVWWHLCHGQSTTTKPPPSPPPFPCTTQSIALLMGNYKLKSNSWNRYRHCARCQRYRSIVNWPTHPLTRYNGLKNLTHTDIHTCRQRWQLSKSYWVIALAIVESRLRCAKTQKLYRDNNSANSHSQFHFYSRCPFDNQMPVWSARWVCNLLRVSSFIHLFIQFWVHSSCSHSTSFCLRAHFTLSDVSNARAQTAKCFHFPISVAPRVFNRKTCFPNLQ